MLRRGHTTVLELVLVEGSEGTLLGLVLLEGSDEGTLLELGLMEGSDEGTLLEPGLLEGSDEDEGTLLELGLLEGSDEGTLLELGLMEGSDEGTLLLHPRSIENLQRKRRNKIIVSVVDEASLGETHGRLYECDKNSLTVAASNKNHTSYHQFDGHGYGGVLLLEGGAPKKCGSAIVDDLDSRRHFCCQFLIYGVSV